MEKNNFDMGTDEDDSFWQDWYDVRKDEIGRSLPPGEVAKKPKQNPREPTARLSRIEGRT